MDSEIVGVMLKGVTPSGDTNKKALELMKVVSRAYAAMMPQRRGFKSNNSALTTARNLQVTNDVSDPKERF